MNSGSEDIPTFKLLLLGDHCVGKTAYLKRHLTGEFEEKYESTPHVQIHPLLFFTSHGPVLFNVWDTSGHHGLQEGYYVQDQHRHCAIIMFDVTAPQTYKSVSYWHRSVTSICDDMPVVLVGNKMDSVERKVREKSVVFQRGKSVEYYEVSAKTSYQYELPLLSLARVLLGNPELIFTAYQKVPMPEMTDEMLQQSKEQAANAPATVLPEDDEDL